MDSTGLAEAAVATGAVGMPPEAAVEDEDELHAAVAQAALSLRDLRVAEISELDLQIEDGQVRAYRAKVKVSFKYEGGQ